MQDGLYIGASTPASGLGASQPLNLNELRTRRGGYSHLWAYRIRRGEYFRRQWLRRSTALGAPVRLAGGIFRWTLAARPVTVFLVNPPCKASVPTTDGQGRQCLHLTARVMPCARDGGSGWRSWVWWRWP